MSRSTSVFGFALTAAIAATATVMAEVTYDPETGGFAGKGDVKDALGLSEADIRALADTLLFTYEDEAEYAVPCRKENRAQVLYNTFTRTREVDAEVSHEARRNGQGVLTGFVLGPASAGDIDGNIACPGGWEADGEPVLLNGGTGGALKVNGVPLADTL